MLLCAFYFLWVNLHLYYAFMNIICTDAFPLNPGDLDWNALKKLGTLTIYDFTAPEVLLERVHQAEVLIVNKTPIRADVLRQLPLLRYIGVTATGYNNIAIAVARQQGITVTNVAGYGSQSVAQHTFALILELANRVGLHEAAVRAGEWSAQPHFCLTKTSLTELAGKTLGLYGFGHIGREVAKIGRAFGMKILVNRRNMTQLPPRGIQYVPMEDLLKNSDIISLNAATDENNQGVFNFAAFQQMKRSAWLINTGRGALLVETDLRMALDTGLIAGAGLDVLNAEPPASNHPLIGTPNCIITPHNAWASTAARQRLMQQTVRNLKAFMNEKPINVVSN